MELFLRQHFELMLQEATGNFTERVVHRCGGPDAAMERLDADPDGRATWTLPGPALRLSLTWAEARSRDSRDPVALTGRG